MRNAMTDCTVGLYSAVGLSSQRFYSGL